MTQPAYFGNIPNSSGSVARPRLNSADMAAATMHKGPSYPGYANQLGFIWCDDSPDPIWIYKMLAGGTDPSVAANWVELYRVHKTIGGLNPPAGGVFRKNAIINGNFDFWQRGTSLAALGAQRYLADRWATSGAGSTVAPSQQAFALGQTAVPGEPTFFHRTVVVSSPGANNLGLMVQRVEGVRSFAGKLVTLSFWAKADAAKNVAVEFVQDFGTGGAPSAIVTGIGVTTCALTTSWQKYTVSVEIPSIAGKTLGSNSNDSLTVAIWFDAGSAFNSRTNTLGQRSGTYDFAQVQLEESPVATAFEDRPRGLELLLCQRYFEKGPYSDIWYWISATSGRATGRYRVPKRATPTVALGTGSLIQQANASTFNSGVNNGVSNPSISAIGGNTESFQADIAASAGPAAQGWSHMFMSGGNSVLWQADAEL